MQGEAMFNLKDFFHVFRKRLKLIIGITLMCTIVSALLSFFVIKPTYESKVRIVIGKSESAQSNKAQYDYNDIMMFQKLVKTYAEIGKSSRVSEDASKKLKNITSDKIDKILTVTPATDTQVLEFKVNYTDANEAHNIVTTVCNSFIQESKKIFPQGNIQIMDEAKVPKSPIKPKKALNIILGFILGLIASIGITFAMEYMDSTIKTEEDIAKYLDLPVIGIIPKHTSIQEK